ncbi:hypothetical protein BOTBODRAFT_28058 [Botryobasidium botryosum FD-172 SS1]|uniref:F-box domain-containing protein n=1 Tax=Botryobasidium botryosum (strain FD-172 SS1) TaxID=930990 RepID=A0A067MUQ7_BOTB1|nr:hypothetical protein BOTBODRAFT_28058 [Botryobasidium botryosum FD-172 SS1]
MSLDNSEAPSFPQLTLQAFIDDNLHKIYADADTPHQGTSPANLDKEIKAVQLAVEAIKECADKRLRDLHRRRNHLSLIYRLPNEILSSIFQFAESFARTRSSSKRLHFLFNISSVSHLWREVALNTPGLWTSLSASLPEGAIEASLDRSKHAALCIQYHSEECNLHFSDFMALVVPHTHRWRTCHIITERSRAIPHFLQTSAPHLETLYLDGEIGTNSRDSSTAFDRIFINHTPHLRELYLDAIFVPLAHPIYAGLTTLHLGNIDYLLQESMFRLLRALEGSPSLEVLELLNLGFTPTVEANPSSNGDMEGPISQPVQLLHLRDLRCTGYQWSERHPLSETRGLRYLLSHIIAPPTLKLAISVRGINLRDVIPISPGSARNLPNLSLIDTLFIQAPRYSVEQLTVSGHCSASPDDELVSFGIGGDHPEHLKLQAIFSHLGHILPMPLLEKLSLSRIKTIEPDSIAAIVAFLGQHSTIQRIEFIDCGTSVIDVLALTPSMRACPLLRELWISDCTIRAHSLIDVVKSRTNQDQLRGGPGTAEVVQLQKLNINQCRGISPLTIRELRRHLVVVCQGQAR